MTLEEIRLRVDRIGEIGDDGTAHEEEDRLHQDVLRAIAEGKCSDPSMCADAALKTLRLDFERWFY